MPMSDLCKWARFTGAVSCPKCATHVTLEGVRMDDSSSVVCPSCKLEFTWHDRVIHTTPMNMLGTPIQPGWKCSVEGCDEEIGNPTNRMNVDITSPHDMDGEGRSFNLCMKHYRRVMGVLEPEEAKIPEPMEKVREHTLCGEVKFKRGIPFQMFIGNTEINSLLMEFKGKVYVKIIEC
jgi:endogenous inhibitor of DNA gyrase (YacG/DUF329 family)